MIAIPLLFAVRKNLREPYCELISVIVVVVTIVRRLPCVERVPDTASNNPRHVEHKECSPRGDPMEALKAIELQRPDKAT
jgi:hypothetical protein